MISARSYLESKTEGNVAAIVAAKAAAVVCKASAAAVVSCVVTFACEAAAVAAALVAVVHADFDTEKPEKSRGSTKLTSGLRKNYSILRVIDIAILLQSI